MANYNLEEEKLEVPYLYSCGDVFEQTYGNVKYLVKSATEFVHDDYIDGVLVSHYLDSGYYFINNFELTNKDETELDLSWIDKNDCIILRDNDDYQNIKSMKVNIDNLNGSYLPSKKDENNYMTLKLDGSKSKLSIRKQVKYFKEFFELNDNCFNKVELNGFNPIVNEILTIYADKYNLLDKEKDKVYTR